VILIVGGVAGTGKTTVGALIAGRMHWKFADADAFHTQACLVKMRAGQPLTDPDRLPWLQRLGTWMDERIAAGDSAVLACSALKRTYRDILLNGRPEAQLVFLTATPEELRDRLAARPGHFFPASMLKSQLAALEPPEPDEDVLTVRSGSNPEQTAGRVLEAIRPRGDREHRAS
jgi:gluconokinase